MNTFQFPNESLNMGVVLMAAYREELDCSDDVNSCANFHDRLETAISASIPKFDDLIEKFREQFGYQNIEELTDGVDESDIEHNQFEEKGYVDLEPYDLLARSLYMTNFAYSFFNQLKAFKAQKEIGLEQYIEQCADHVMTNLLKASQVLNEHFEMYESCPVESYLKTLVTQTENLKELANWDAMEYVIEVEGAKGAVMLATFNHNMIDNFLTLNDEYAEGCYSYHY